MNMPYRKNEPDGPRKNTAASARQTPPSAGISADDGNTLVYSPENRNRLAVILLLVCTASLLLFLDDAPFNTRGEPREAVVAMSMLHDGNWILPVNNGDEIAFKPPLLHWLVAAFSLVAGGVSEFTSRLPSALSAIGMVMATFFFFARRRGFYVAFVTALLTLSNFEVHRAAMACRVDMLLAALTVLAVYALYCWGERSLRGVPWAGVVLLAGAALTKGPVGVVLPCGAVALALLVAGRAPFGRLVWRFALVALVALLPLALWYWAAYNQPHGGERFLRLIYEENVLRFTGQMTYASHINPWPYNIMTMLTGLLPYTLVFVFAAPLGLRAVRRCDFGALLGRLRQLRPVSAARGILAAARRMEPARLFALVAFLTIFIFYCIPASKRSVYLLPAYPFAACFLADYLLWIMRRHPRTFRAFGLTLAAVAMLAVVTFIAVRLGLVPESLFAGLKLAVVIPFLHALATETLGFKGWALVALALYMPVLLRRYRRVAGPIRVAGVVVVINLLLDGLLLPAIMEVKSDRTVARRIEQLAPQGRLYSYRTDVLEANRMHPFTINFYLGDRIIPIDKARPLPETGLLVTGDDEIVEFSRRYPAYAARLVYDSGHRSCDDRKVVKVYRLERRAGL